MVQQLARLPLKTKIASSSPTQTFYFPFNVFIFNIKRQFLLNKIGFVYFKAVFDTWFK